MPTLDYRKKFAGLSYFQKKKKGENPQKHGRKMKDNVVHGCYRNFLNSPAAYSNCFFPTDIQETSAAWE